MKNSSKTNYFTFILSIISGLVSIKFVDLYINGKEIFSNNNLFTLFITSLIIFAICFCLMLHSHIKSISEKNENNVNKNDDIKRNKRFTSIYNIVINKPFIALLFILFCYSNYKICQQILWWAEISFTSISLCTLFILFYFTIIASYTLKKKFFSFPFLIFIFLTSLGIYDLITLDDNQYVINIILDNKISLRLNSYQAIEVFKAYLCVGLNFLIWIPIAYLYEKHFHLFENKD